ncbi:MAG: YbaB/EbfC family nucleoid-associated protein [Anaerolineae bacterium]|jgi:DNA-binding YbaB/EbfC family protein
MASKGRGRFRAPQAGGGRQGDMLKQLQALQSQMEEAQASLEQEVVTATAGGGAITIEMTGSQELRSVTIKPEVVDPEDVEMLQDLIMAAFKEAQAKVAQLAQDRMSPFAAGLDVGGLI